MDFSDTAMKLTRQHTGSLALNKYCSAAPKPTRHERSRLKKPCSS